MKKNMVLLIPFFVGLSLMVFSWLESYPLYAEAGDLIFYQVSIYYWISVPLILGSLFGIALTTENILLKWILSLGIVLTFYSIFYFYLTMPTSDSQFFRGLNQFFFQTKSLDASQINHTYYQWPSFFILSYIVTSVTGLSLVNFEFLMFTLVGILITTCLYVYFFKKYEKGAFYAVIAFFVTMYLFFNYQAVPFSLAIGIFFILLMIDFKPKNITVIITGAILYTGLLLTHVFVPLFFVIYLLIRSVLDRSLSYFRLFVISLISYFAVQLTLARFSLEATIEGIIRPPQEYANMATNTFVPAASQFDVIAQFFSRSVTISFALVCVIGFVILYRKRKLTVFNKALLITGILYTVLGAVINTLGWRAISIAFIPIALGAAYLTEGKFKLHFRGIFLILLLLFVFIPIHQTFGNQVTYQTNEAYQAENFFVDHYNPENQKAIFMGFRAATFVSPKLPNYTDISVNLENLGRSEIIILTSELLGENGLGENLTSTDFTQDTRLDGVYSNGFSYIVMKP